MARAIVVIGTPGVGKSTLARALAKEFRLRFVDLGLLVKKEGLYSRHDLARRSLIADEVRVRRRLKGLLSTGDDIVIETHYLGRLIERRKVRLILVIRLDPVILFRRLRRRGWSKRKAWENAESELVDVCLFDAAEHVGEARVFQIDATSKPVPRVLQEALGIVSKRGRRLKVNWLDKYDPVVLAGKFGWKSVT